MKTKNWEINKPLTFEQQEKINRFKSEFKIYFEGLSCVWFEPIDDIPIYKFGINGLDFFFEQDTENGMETMIVSINLSRPGILIGKAGRTINGLTEYLQKHVGPIKIHLGEVDLFYVNSIDPNTNKYEVFIDGKLHHKTVDQNEAIWNLGAKFGDLTYKAMYKKGLIRILPNRIYVYTLED